MEAELDSAAECGSRVQHTLIFVSTPYGRAISSCARNVCRARATHVLRRALAAPSLSCGANESCTEPTMPHLANMAFLVRDHDEAIQYFTDSLGFVLLEDTPMTPEKRWVRVSPRGAQETPLLLARAVTPDQQAAIGRQGGGRVTFFLHTDDFDRDYSSMKARGVRFIEAPRNEPYGRVVVFEDLYGNRWDLVASRGG